MDYEDIMRDLYYRVTRGYRLLAKVLARLDIPIALEELDVEGIGDFEMKHYDAISMAVRLLEEAPMGRLLRAALRTACLDWLSSMTLGALAVEGEPHAHGEDWLYKAAILNATRVMLSLDAATQILDHGEPESQG